MFTILFVLAVTYLKVFHLTEKLNKKTLYEDVTFMEGDTGGPWTPQHRKNNT